MNPDIVPIQPLVSFLTPEVAGYPLSLPYHSKNDNTLPSETPKLLLDAHPATQSFPLFKQYANGTPKKFGTFKLPKLTFKNTIPTGLQQLAIR